MGTYRVIAINHAESSENRIHSDEIASRLGFRGALVPGVAVYGYMTHPLVERLGEAWLSSHATNVRFFKPAYDGEEIRIDLTQTGGDDGPDGERAWEVTCHGPTGERLAVLQTRTPCNAQPEPAAPIFSRTPVSRDRVLISSSTIDLEHPLPVWHWNADRSGNIEYTAQVADGLPCYERHIHPHWALATANYMLVRSYVMPAWIHVGSEIRQHRAMQVGTTIDVAAACVERWERKGHEFVRLDLRYSDAEGLISEVRHTAIYKVAGA